MANLMAVNLLDNDMEEPLLSTDSEDSSKHEMSLDSDSKSPTLVRFQRSAKIMGFLVGFFIQFSTLGANFLLLACLGEDVLLRSKVQVILFSLGWSTLTSAMAIVVLHMLREMLTVAFNAVNRESEDVLEYLFLLMESQFVCGVLIGVCLAWLLTDIFLGMRSQLAYTAMTLVMALVWCHVLIWLYRKRVPFRKPDAEAGLSQV